MHYFYTDTLYKCCNGHVDCRFMTQSSSEHAGMFLHLSQMFFPLFCGMKLEAV